MELNISNGQSAEPADGATDLASFSIVGVGASAGGLKAFFEFFSAMPEEPGMAFVLVQHLAPNHESELAELLQNHTPLRVVQVVDGVRAEADGVYVIPPGKALSIHDGVLRLSEPEFPHGHRAPIDDFFRSLAADQGERAVCVVLSGTGSDGTLGLKTLKEAGGLTMAQDPDDAEYDGMPRSAISTGLVDVVLPAKELSERLVDLRQKGLPIAPTAEALPERDSDALTHIFAQLRDDTGHDFARYKQSTVRRRIGRRMQVVGTSDLPGYLRFIRKNPHEIRTLLKDLLISVTNFFRDPDAFVALEQQVIPKLFEGKGAEDQVRVWVPGCATGEEAYSIAMLLCEHAACLDSPPGLQVFATDIDEQALAFAREGLYPEPIKADLSHERLRRFFEYEAVSYRVKKSIREIVLVAVHNVLKDPPFSKIDLVSCRNLLIYLQRETQQQVFELFAYALREPGFLFLGTSESVEGTKDLFSTVDKKRRLFQARGVMRQGLRFPIMPPLSAASLRRKETKPQEDEEAPASLDDLHWQLLMTYHAPPSVIVNPSHEILHIAGDVSRYLAFAPGHPTNDVLKVARPGLRPELRTALYHAIEKQRTTDRLRVRAQIGGEPVIVVLTVRPLRETDGADGLVQIVFEEEPAPEDVPLPAGGEESPALEHLESEFQRTKERLQSTIEELSTVNQELKTKIEEINRANADLKNLIDSTDVATLFLDRDFRIKRYTPPLGELFNVLPTDRGRPIGHLTQNVAYPSFVDDARTVLETLIPLEREVSGDDGRSFLTRIVPYRTVDDRIDGVVATFLDITRRVQAEQTAARREARFRRAIIDAPIPVLLHTEDGEILQLSRAVTELTGYTPEEIPTIEAWVERAYGADGGERITPDIERLYDLDGRMDEGEFHVRTKSGEERVWQFSSSPVGTDGQGRRLVISVAADVTERRRAEEARQLALEGGQLGTWSRDLAADTMTFDTRCRELYGMTPDAPSEEALAHVHPDERDAIQAAIEAALDPAGSGTYTVEHRLLGPDGEVFWLAVRGRCSFQGEGAERHPTRLAGVVLDITERKRAEAEREVRIHQQAALAAFGLDVLTETDRQSLFDRAVAVVHETLGGDFTKVLELQPGGDALLLRAGLGWDSGLVGTAMVTTDPSSQAGYTMTIDEPVIVEDLAAETRFWGPVLLTEHGVRSGVSVVVGGLTEPFGVFGTHSQRAFAFSPADAAFLQSVANVVASAIDRMEAMQHLEERVEERTLNLRKSEPRLRLLYDVVSHPADSLAAQIDRAFHLVTDLLGLDVGILSHVEGDVYTVEHCYAPGTGLERGQTFALGTTPCTITLETKAPLAIDQLSASEHHGHPCRDAFDIESYIGAPIRVGDSVYGTLNFSSPEPKVPPFSDGDRELVVLLAQWLGSAFEQEAAETALHSEKEWSEQIVEGSFDGIIAFDTDLRYTIWNPGAERITGIPAEDVLGQPSYEVFPILRENGDLERQQAALAGKSALSGALPYVIPQTGKSGYYESRYTPLYGASGEIVGALGIFRDVTDRKRVQDEIERSEQMLAGVLLGSLDGITAFEALRDESGEIEDFVWIIANPTAAALARQDAVHLLGSRLSQTLPGIHVSGFFAEFVRVVATGEPIQGLRHYASGPVEGWFEYSAVKLGDGLAVTVRDVTERKQTEEDLRASEERFRELFQSSPDAIFVENLDGVVLDVNPAACRLHNADRAWLIGRDLSELVPPEYRERAQADFERLASGSLSLLESQSFTADGLIVPVEVRTDRITYAGQDAVLLHVRDVTERDAVERALCESEERFAKAFHAAPVAMSISTFSENRLLDVNESYCALTGYTRAELLGLTPAELDLLPHAPPIPHADDLEATGSVRSVELTLRTKSGVLRDVLVSAELIDIGGLRCILGIGFDMTERKRLEREVIEAAELERRRIGQDLHDELGQQLTGAAFLGQVLGQKLAAADRPEAEDAGQLTELINHALAEMRDLSRLLSPVDIQAEGLMDALQTLADQTERVFGVACWLRTEGDVRVADNVAATHLFRIGQEAVNNAVKHAGPSEIEIALTHDAKGLHLAVTDDGTGIDPAMIQHPSGLGLRTMRYRASLIGATLHIGRQKRGSVVAVLLPDAHKDTL